MDPTLQVPRQYCSLQHQTLLSSPDTPTAEHCSHFDPVASFLLELLVIALRSSQVAYWSPSNLGTRVVAHLPASYLCLFILPMGFYRQEYWSRLPFPSLLDHVLSELFTITCLSWVALHGMPHSFTEPDKFQDGGLEGRVLFRSYPQYELNSPIPVHFSLPIPKMSTFTLAISCLTTSNLP